MFNTYITKKTEKEYIPYEKTITINRAPTDKSIELLKEFEEKSIQKIVDSFVINNNILNGIVVAFSNPCTRNITYRFKFNLNGKDYNFEERANDSDILDRYKLMSRLYKLAAENIANQLLTNSRIME